MPKPWAKYDVDFINHDKFRAIPPAAICLWLEGKSYADSKFTDGLLPAYEVRHWRFYSKANVASLTASVGLKPGTTQPYAALWEAHELGWKMHDYLDWNDCRDKVIQRKFDAQVKKQRETDRKAEWRAKKLAKAADVPRDTTRDTTRDNAGQSRPNVPMSRSMSEVRSQKSERAEERDAVPRDTTARSNRIVFPGQRVKVFEWMFDDLCGLLGPHLDAFDLHRWFYDLDARCLGDGTIPPPRDGGAWLQAQTLAEAQRRGLPLVVVSAAGEADAWAAIARKGPSVRP